MADMMCAEEFYRLVAARQSDRAYDTERPVEPEKVQRILEATRLSPSACNGQPWYFIVVTDSQLREDIARSMAGLGLNKWATQAPILILIVEEATKTTSLLGGLIKHNHYPHIDLGIAAAHLTLAAEAEGLGSCMIGYFDEKKIKKMVGVPRRKRLPLIITLGYAAKEKRSKKRKGLDEIVSYNKYND